MLPSMFYSLVPLILAVNSCPVRYLDKGELCQLQNGNTGTCQLYDDCPSAQDQYKNHQVFPLVCRYVPGKTQPVVPIVCCDELYQPQVTEPTTTISTTTLLTSTTKNIVTRYASEDLTTETSTPVQSTTEECTEYSKWIPKNDPEGNIPSKPHTPVFGGKKALPKEFPYMARLGYAENDGKPEDQTWECGGSIINEKFVLTAAHCMRNRQGVPVHSVRVGHGDPDNIVIKKVLRRIPHPDYKQPNRYNDIALLELDDKLTFNDYIGPGCLQTERNLDKNRSIATGWGATETAQSSEDLLRVKLPIVPHAECSSLYVSNRVLKKGIDEDTMFCAGDSTVPKDTCHGDSGGPLQISLKKPTCTFTIVGITSFGVKCGVAPGVYTRVSAYIPWIDSIICSK